MIVPHRSFSINHFFHSLQVTIKTNLWQSLSTKHRTKSLSHQTGNYPVTCFVSRPSGITLVQFPTLQVPIMTARYEIGFRGRAGRIVIIYVFFHIFENKRICRCGDTICTLFQWPVKHVIRKTTHTSRTEPVLVQDQYLKLKLTFTSILLYNSYINQKHALMCLHPVKLFLNFGHSAARYPNNYGTQGSVTCLNRWEYQQQQLSPKLNAEQHRWRENSYGFQLD